MKKTAAQLGDTPQKNIQLLLQDTLPAVLTYSMSYKLSQFLLSMYGLMFFFSIMKMLLIQADHSLCSLAERKL